ncbi:MAG: preprotein translocase subunit SecE [Microcoleaceae cyanobacterium]
MVKKDEVKSAETADKPSPIFSFFQEAREELSKVVWPSRQQLFSESAVVLLMVILSAATIYLVDNLLRGISGQIFQ